MDRIIDFLYLENEVVDAELVAAALSVAGMECQIRRVETRRAETRRKKESAGHIRRVTDAAVDLAILAGLDRFALLNIWRGALLHDIGKLGVPEQILLKPGPLTDQEWQIMRLHPRFAYDMLNPIDFLRPALDIPYCHHEKWDGTGYPRGLKGEEIPLAARLFSIVDVWDALTCDRPYRPAWSQEKIRAYILKQAGTQFDQHLAKLFVQMLEDADIFRLHEKAFVM
jgi:HD-GYP domain-containing protein (c-di-GMP phosphodiesterase class II)